jgi:hypothetical protein
MFSVNALSKPRSVTTGPLALRSAGGFVRSLIASFPDQEAITRMILRYG